MGFFRARVSRTSRISRIKTNGLDFDNTANISAHCETHGRLKARIRREDLAAEKQRISDERLFTDEPYRILLSLPNAKQHIELEPSDTLKLSIPIDKKKVSTQQFIIQTVEALTEGLHCSGIIHRCICTVSPVYA